MYLINFTFYILQVCVIFNNYRVAFLTDLIARFDQGKTMSM